MTHIYNVEPGQSITAAIAAAEQGDTILLAAGTYRERVTVNKAGLTIEPVAGAYVEWDGGYSPALFTNSAGYVDWNGQAVKLGKLPSPTAANIAKGKWVTASGKYSPLVSVTADGVTLRGLTIRNVAGRGVSANTVDGVTIENCTIDFTYANPIHAINCTNLTIRNNRITRGSLKYFDPSHGSPVVDSCVYPKTCNNVTIEGNVLAYCWGEGINCGQGSDYVTIQGNTVHTTHHGAIYCDGGNHLTISDNVVYWRKDLADEMQTTGQHGLAVVDEERTWTNTIFTIEGNVIVGGFKDALHIPNGNPTNSPTWNRAIAMRDCVITNNTFVADPASDRGNFFGETAQYPHIDADISYNIFLMRPGNPSMIAKTDGKYTNVVFDTNLWNETPPVPLQGADDILTVAPVLVDPFRAIGGGGFFIDQSNIPDALDTTFDLDNYRPLADGPAVGELLIGALEPLVISPPPPDTSVKDALTVLEGAIGNVELMTEGINVLIAELKGNLDSLGAAFEEVIKAVNKE